MPIIDPEPRGCGSDALWKARPSEGPPSHRAWKTRGGFPTAPQPRRRRGSFFSNSALTLYRGTAIGRLLNLGNKDSKLPEEKKMGIYKDLKEEIDSVFLLGTDLLSNIASASRDPLGGLGKMGQVVEKSGKEANDRAIGTISSRYGIERSEVLLIQKEGDKKNWPFKAVAR